MIYLLSVHYLSSCYLQEPVAQGTAAVAASVSQRVAAGYKPQSKINGEPSFPVVIGVAVESRRIATQDVFETAVREISTV